jgi:hypothetical protein
VVTKITPQALGRSGGGARLVLHGTNLSGVRSVHFGAAEAVFRSVSATRLIVVVPAGHGSLRSGVTHVTVTTSAGTSKPTRRDLFTYLSVPVLSRVSPDHGPATGGERVLITGSYLHGVSQVLFGGKAALSFAMLSPTRLEAIAPPGVGRVEVKIRTAGGTSRPSTASHFSYGG